jgi:hypothetical protein
MPQKSYFGPMPILKKYGEQIRSMGQDPHKERNNKLTVHQIAKSKSYAEISDTENQSEGDQTKSEFTEPKLSAVESNQISEPSHNGSNQDLQSTKLDQPTRLGSDLGQESKPKTKRSGKLELKKKQ